MKFVSFFLTLFLCLQTYAMVDMQNANFTDTWTDVDLQSGGFNLKIVRTYNSRTLYNGMFGFGWCSNFETALTILPDNRVKRTECGAGLEVNYSTKTYNLTDVDSAVEKILLAVKKGNPTSSDGELRRLREELRKDPDRREAEAKIYNIKSDLKKGTILYAEDESSDKITLRRDYYERILSDGNTQKYDLQGRLVGISDSKGNFITVEYRDNKISTITTNDGQKLSFSYDAHGKVSGIKGPRGIDMSYRYEKISDLVYAKTAPNEIFQYAYDSLHNLTKISYPDKTSKTLRYNTDKDWVVALVDREGCEERYDYVLSKNDPQNNYSSIVTKKCANKIVTQSKFEFWFKKRAGGGPKYLARLYSEVNGVKTDINYHEIFARPTSVTRDGKTTTYTYHSNSFLKSQKTGDKIIFYDYDWRFNKVSEITEGKSKTKFEYDKSGNLVKATSTSGQIVRLAYDGKGRITSINDQARRLIKIEYDERYNKPKLVERPGVGTILVTYKTNGEIDDVKSKDGDTTVAVQVASAFNNLLEIVAPAGINLGI